MNFKQFEKEICDRLSKYPFLKWRNKKTANLVKILYKDGLSVSDSIRIIVNIN